MYEILKIFFDIFTNKQKKRYITFIIVYCTFLLDNLLLTVVVPIIPDYLHTNSLTLLANTKSPLFSNFKITNLKDKTADKLINGLKEEDNESEKYISDNKPKQLVDNFIKVTELAKQNELLNNPNVKAVDKLINGLKEEDNGTEENISYNKPKQLADDFSRVTKLAQENELLETRSMNIDFNGNQTKVIGTPMRNLDFESENVPVGILLSSKAFVQLLFNPVIGAWIPKVGYKLPIIFGTFNLLLASLLFAWCEDWWGLLCARAVQGVASACVNVAGMSLASDLFVSHDERSRNIGVLMGSVALGVLIGYPFGSITYDLWSKSTPFIIIAAMLIFNLAFQILLLDNTYSEQDHSETLSTNDLGSLFKNVRIMVMIGAIFTSTSAMAMLEPCLPLWMLDHLKPAKWQLGTVFIPDSIGYLIGTNLFGGISLFFGQTNVGVIAVFIVGLAAHVIPFSTSLWFLAAPQFILGLGIGAVDSAMVPAIVSISQTHSFGISSVFTLHQSSVSFAYFLAPILGSEVSHWFGFDDAMKAIGFVNMAYSLLLLYVHRRYRQHEQYECFHLEEIQHSSTTSENSSFYNGLELID